MSEYRVQAIDYSGDYMPEGDGYAPQIVLTASHGRLENVANLNTDSLPFTVEQFKEWRDEIAERFRYVNGKRYGRDGEVLTRFMKIFFDLEMIHAGTSGYSQGDWGETFIFGTPEFYKTTGAPGIEDSDHNDLCAWVWGDVYEVTQIHSPEVSHVETCNLGHEHTVIDSPEVSDTFIVYGMDEAEKFGEIEGL